MIKKLMRIRDNADVYQMIVIITVIIGLCVVVITERINESEIRKHEELIIQGRRDTVTAISKIDDDNLKLNSAIYANILKIYDRIKVISEQNPDEIRDKVITSVNLEDSSLIVEASIVALLKNYEEFQDDPEIQVYLNENVTIMNKIEDNNEIKNSLMEILKNYASFNEPTEMEIIDTEND